MDSSLECCNLVSSCILQQSNFFVTKTIKFVTAVHQMLFLWLFSALALIDECDIDQCDWCSSPDYCGHCQSGYAVDSWYGDCQPCSAHCQDCSIPETCNNCVTGYGVIKDTCLKCNDANCMECNGDITQCHSCQGGFAMINHTCIACTVSHCLTCDDDIDVCTFCDFGWREEGNVCEEGLSDVHIAVVAITVIVVVGIITCVCLYCRYRRNDDGFSKYNESDMMSQNSLL